MRALNLTQIASLLNYSSISLSTSPIQGISIDSRAVKAGDLFFALKGEKVDGHHYVREAQKKGACGAVVARSYGEFLPGFSLLFVDDPLHTLQELAKIILKQSDTRVVAITGSIGKTSTKEFTKSLLATKFSVAASPGNYNTQISLPLTILNHTTGLEKILILEMGMTAAGHLSRLVQIAPPEVAVLTCVELVHACGFDSIEEIAWAKAEIFSHPHTRLGILDRDIPNYTKILKATSCHKVAFSTGRQAADYQLDLEEKNSFCVEANLENLKHDLGPLSFPGRHHCHNLLAAVAVARYFKVDWQEIKQAIPHLQLPERRLQFIRHKYGLFLNDSYNACERSMKAALETLPSPSAKGRKIGVLGSMLELGKFSEESHRRLGEFALKHVEQLYCLGEECRPMYELWQQKGHPVELFLERRSLVERLRQDLKAEDVVLLKGSCGKELWKVLEEL